MNKHPFVNYLESDGLITGMIAGGLTSPFAASQWLVIPGVILGVGMGNPVARGKVKWYWPAAVFVMFLAALATHR
jgi:hypothetical protein